MKDARSNSKFAKSVRGLFYFFGMPLVLFLCAGTVHWWQAWLFIITGYVGAMGSRMLLVRIHPDLASERVNYDSVENVKPWDRLLMPLVAIYLPILQYLVAGLDKRFGWTPPLDASVTWLAWGLMVAGYAFSTWAMIENRFFSAVVRIQTERGHSVVSTGPYRFIRHPGYASGIGIMLVSPLVLGTLWMFLPVVMTCGVLVARTRLEDLTLQEELPGYREYSQKTRYRLLPKIW